MNAKFFKPTVEALERRETPAVLLAVNAAQIADVYDKAGFDGEADIGQAVNLPAKGQNAAILLKIPGTLGLDHDHYLATVVGGILQESYCNVSALEASAIAAAQGLPMFELTEFVVDDGKLMADPSLVESLRGNDVGAVFTDAQLTEFLDVIPATLTAPGEPLKLAVEVDGGFIVHSLELTEAFGESAWTLMDSVFVATLTPAAGLYQLKV